MLIPTLPRLWRDPCRIQLGVDPDRAVVVELGHPIWARVLDLLDGSRTETGVCREAARDGVPPTDSIALVTALRTAGLVVDAWSLHPTGLDDPARRRLRAEAAALALHRPAHGSPAAVLRRRRAARVLVTGASQLAIPIAAALAAAGVGRSWPDVQGVAQPGDATPGGLLPTDAQRPRQPAARAAVRRVAPEADLTPLRIAQATFAVLVGATAPPTLTALSLAARRVAHLAVGIRDGVVVVGPLVRPGQTPCLNCLDLHRGDRDPAWPRIAAQLGSGAGAAQAVATATALAGVGYAVAEVLKHVDGDAPSTLATTVELIEPGRERRRRWTSHPRCGCVSSRHGRGPNIRRGVPGSAGRSDQCPPGQSEREVGVRSDIVAPVARAPQR
jgi:bacteriocin biosynthesis cyclodehydratase domain-containing protein